MPRRPSLHRRLTTATRWPVGVALTSWRYMWRTTPMHRSEGIGSPRHDDPPPLPAGAELEEVQRARDGAGPLFHRRYAARIRNPQLSAPQLMQRVQGDLQAIAPRDMASFQKVHGGDSMRIGDEYVVRMPGPWDGPVRVVAVTPTSFRLVTLETHLEAGQIAFRVEEDEEGRLRFEIESWARSADNLVHVLYDKLRMAKEIQLHMWTSMLERVAKLSGGRIDGGIDIDTRRVGDPERLAALRALEVNYDPDGPIDEEHGWRIDDYCQPLPRGSFETAQQLLRDYRVADPSIVRAFYDEDAPLEGRDMLLELRFHGIAVHAGCRVGEVTDEERIEDGRPVRVWGWPYMTLEGHVEQGQMDWEVWEWQDTGDVEFRIHSFSRMAKISNPFVALGFRLFGQRERERYLRTACRRMAELTACAGDSPSSSPVSDSPRRRAPMSLQT